MIGQSFQHTPKRRRALSISLSVARIHMYVVCFRLVAHRHQSPGYFTFCTATKTYTLRTRPGKPGYTLQSTRALAKKVGERTPRIFYYLAGETTPSIRRTHQSNQIGPHTTTPRAYRSPWSICSTEHGLQPSVIIIPNKTPGLP